MAPLRVITQYLYTTFSQELVTRPEWHLNNSTEFGHLAGNVVLNVCNTLCNTRTRCQYDFKNKRGKRTSKYTMSCFTIFFHPTKRSMRMSDGRRSLGAIFFLMSDWLRLIVELLWLAWEIEVTRESDAPSFCIVMSSAYNVCVVDGGKK